MLAQHKDSIEGKKVLISGSGNVATHAAEKCLQLGALPLTLSDSGGFVHCADGFTQEQVDWIKELKGVRRGRISEAADEFSNVTFHEGRPWSVEASTLQGRPSWKVTLENSSAASEILPRRTPFSSFIQSTCSCVKPSAQ